MMKKIVSPKDIEPLITRLQKNGEKIVLAGGCFDILHEGHLIFLKSAKKEGTKLIILLEDDENVKRLKGNNRPVHPQIERAKILSSVKSIDYVILLSGMKKPEDYAKLINQIKPSAIAVTSDDPYLESKEKQARNIGARIISVTKRIEGKSTTKLISLINKNL
jgi:FAD synthetase